MLMQNMHKVGHVLCFQKMHYEHFQEAGVIYSTFNLPNTITNYIHQEALQPFVQRSHFIYTMLLEQGRFSSTQFALIIRVKVN